MICQTVVNLSFFRESCFAQLKCEISCTLGKIQRNARVSLTGPKGTWLCRATGTIWSMKTVTRKNTRAGFPKIGKARWKSVDEFLLIFPVTRSGRVPFNLTYCRATIFRCVCRIQNHVWTRIVRSTTCSRLVLVCRSKYLSEKRNCCERKALANVINTYIIGNVQI